jgi:hypothetical protein
VSHAFSKSAIVGTFAIATLAFAYACDDDDAPAETGVEAITADFLQAAADHDAEAMHTLWDPYGQPDVEWFEDMLSRTPHDLTDCNVDDADSTVTEGNGGLYVDVTFPDPCGDSGVVTACEVWLRRSESQWRVAQYSCTLGETEET